MNKFGKLLKKYRVKAGVKSSHLAEQLAVSRAYIATIESGKQPPPTFEKCKRMAEILNLNDKQKLGLYIGAFENRASEDVKSFLNHIGKLSNTPAATTNTTYRKFSQQVTPQVSLDVSIPLMSTPQQKITPPYPQDLIYNHITISEVMSSYYYAIRYDGTSLDSNEFNRNDILVIDPMYQYLQTNDYVLVKLGKKVSIQQYKLLQSDRQLFIQFEPESTKHNLIFDPVNQRGFEIFGKVVFSLKSY